MNLACTLLRHMAEQGCTHTQMRAVENALATITPPPVMARLVAKESKVIVWQDEDSDRAYEVHYDPIPQFRR